MSCLDVLCLLVFVVDSFETASDWVCLTPKGQYGSYQIPKSGVLLGVNLTYQSGRRYWQPGTTTIYQGIWGQTHGQNYMTWVTDSQNATIYPTRSTQDVSAISAPQYYKMVQNNVNSPVLTLMHPTRNVNAGDELRFFDGEYLFQPQQAHQYHGEVCFTVQLIWKRVCARLLRRRTFFLARRRRNRSKCERTKKKTQRIIGHVLKLASSILSPP